MPDSDKPAPLRYSGMHEGNIDIMFWKVIKYMMEKKTDDAISLGGEYVKLFPPLLVKYLNKPEVSAYLVDVSPQILAYLMFKFFILLKCYGCIVNVLKGIKDKFSVVIAIVRLMDENEEAIVNVIKSILKDNDLKVVGIDIIKHMDKEKGEIFLDEIISIAKKDVGMAQYAALEVLTSYVDDDRVEDLFISYIDDWDKKVRQISAIALMNGKKKEEIIDRVKSAMRFERDKYVLFLYKRLLNKFGGSHDA